MKFLQSIKQKLQKLSKKSRVAMGMGAAVAIVASGALVYAGYSPADRPVYDWNNPAHRVGSTDGPRINSFTNTPDFGDERAFFDARLAENTQTNAYADVLRDVSSGDSKEIVMRTYIHNGANQTTNCTPNHIITNAKGEQDCSQIDAGSPGIAKDLKVRIDLPTAEASDLRARSYVSISNPAPGYPAEVTDTAELTDGGKFTVEYVAGSARAYNAANPAPNGTPVSDSIVTSGASVGYNTMASSTLPGCFHFQTFVEIKVRIKVKKPTMEKLVRVADSDKNTAGDQAGPYGKFVSVAPGDKVQWKLHFLNDGNVDLTNIRVTDQMPPHMQLVPNSVRWIYHDSVTNTDKDVVQPDGPLFNGAFVEDKTTWKHGGGFYLRFDTIAKDDLGDDCKATVRNLAHVTTTQTPDRVTDYSDVEIVKQNCTPPVKSFSCTSLTKNQLSVNSYSFKATGAVQNTTITSYLFKVDGVEKQNNASDTLALTNLAEGSYKVTVQIVTPIGTSNVSDACSQTVTVDIPETPVYTCDGITKQFVSGTTYRFTTAATALNGATVKQYRYSFTGSGYNQSGLSNAANGQIDHEFPKTPGDYSISVTVDFNLPNGQVVSHTAAACRTTITVPKENCTVPGKENLPKDSPECKVTPGTPTTLPNTGAGDVVGIFAAVTMAGALAHRYILSRRFQ